MPVKKSTAKKSTTRGGSTPTRTRRTRTTTDENGNGTTTRTRRARVRRPVVPMTAAVKSAAIAALTAFEQALAEDKGFEGASTRNGKNGTLMKAVKIDGHRAVVSVRYR